MFFLLKHTWRKTPTHAHTCYITHMLHTHGGAMTTMGRANVVARMAGVCKTRLRARMSNDI